MKSFFLTQALRGGSLTLALMAAVASLTAPCSGQPIAKGLKRSLASPATGRWRDAPLAPSVNRLADAFSTPLWIDRRIDPSTPITLTADEGTLASMLDRFAAASEAKAATLDRVVYLGPAKSAAALPWLAEQWRRSPPRGMKRRSETTWPRLTTPRSLAEALAAEAGCQLANADAIPHDLWPAGGTPRLMVGDRLTLVLLGFDRRWSIEPNDKRRVLIEPIDYTQAPTNTTTLASRLRGKQPTAPTEQRYTLRVVSQPLDAVMKQLAGQLGRELAIDAGLDEPGKRVSFEVTQATLEELLNAVGTAAECRVAEAEGVIRITPRD